jgi:hypothetical protein
MAAPAIESAPVKAAGLVAALLDCRAAALPRLVDTSHRFDIDRRVCLSQSSGSVDRVRHLV